MTLAQLELSQAEESQTLQGDRLLCREAATPSNTIMIVDDEPINIKVVQKYLRNAGYTHFVSTSDSRQAIDMIRLQQPDCILLDIVMPHVNGINILEVIRGDRELAHLPVLFLTATTDEKTKAYALELGATDFLHKPVKPTELVPRIRNALLLKSHHDQMVAYSKRLEQDVRQRTAELTRAREELIHVLACAAEYRDQETGNHVLRVGRYIAIVARELGFSEARAELIEQAAVLHDVGKIGIPDAILLKPGRLTDQEMEVMRKHCEYGMNILRAAPNGEHEGISYSDRSGPTIRSPILNMAATIAMSHHEKWDGSGYPLGLSGEDIPLEGRITAVADVFDALGSRRPYKDAMPLEKCLQILEQGRGKHFDPRVLDAFFARSTEIIKVSRDMAD